MKYNSEYIDIKYTLIKTFLIEADKSLLDVSYDVKENSLLIQIVLLEGSDWEKSIKERIQQNLSEWQVDLTILFITKERFNETIGEWNPKYYSWLKYLLFSKAEIIW